MTTENSTYDPNDCTGAGGSLNPNFIGGPNHKNPYSNYTLTAAGTTTYTVPSTTQWVTTATIAAPNQWGTTWAAPSNKISVNGEDADLVINGKSMKKTLEDIEARLGILSPNLSLEADFEQLKKLGDRYRKLEKKLLSQKKVFDILKDDK